MRLAIFVTLILLTFFLALINGLEVFYRVSYALAGLLALSYVWSLVSLRDIIVRSTVGNNSLQVGQSAVSQLTIHNNSLLPKIDLEVYQRSEVPGHGVSRIVSLSPHRTVTWTDHFLCERRGRYNLGPTTIVGADLLGIFRRTKESGDLNRVTVYPAPVELPNFAIPPADLPGEGRYRRRTHFVTPNASTVREYSFGDGFNRIHWPSSAKTGQLMVKEFELDPASEIWLMLDLHGDTQAGEGLDSTEEYGVTLAASIAKKYLDSNRSIGFITYGEEYLLLKPDRGSHQLSRVMEALAIAKARGPVPLHSFIASESRRFGKYTTLIVVTPSSDDRWISSAQSLMRRGAKIAVVLLESSSFGVAESPLLSLSTLLACGIQTYLVRKGDNLSQTLSSAGEQSARYAGLPR